MVKKEPEVPTVPGSYESRAFFAALMAAVKGDDELAAGILRDIAGRMTEEFRPKGS